MGEQTARFAIEIDDKSNGFAADLAGELEGLKGAIIGDLAQIRNMNAALRNLKGAASPNIEMMSKLKDQIAVQKASVAATQAQYIKLGGTFEKTKRPGDEVKTSLGSLKDITQALPAPLQKLVGGLQKVMSASGAARTALLTAAYVALGAAVGLVTGKLMAYGIAQSGARRAEEMRLEGMVKRRDWWGRPAGDAKQLQAAIDSASDSVAMGRGEVAKYQEELYRAGLRGGTLKTALEGISLVAATQGDQEAQVFKSLALGAAYAGRSVKAMTEDAKARLGELNARKMLDLDVQSMKLRENFARITDGLKLEGLLKAVNMVSELFSQSSASGRALKTIFNGIFQPMINSLEFLGPLAKRFMQGLIIGGLLVAIGFFKVRNAVRDLIPDSTIKGIDTARAALALGAITAGVLATALGFVAIKLAIITAPIWLTAAALAGLFAIGWKLGEWLTSVDWAGIATNIITGLVYGITSGAKKVWGAMKDLAKGVVKSFNAEMEIKSPSRKMFKSGIELPSGAAVGVRAGTPRLESAVGKMSKKGSVNFEKNFKLPSLEKKFEVSAAPLIPPSGGGKKSEARGPRDTSRSKQHKASAAVHIGSVTLQTAKEKTQEEAQDLWEQFSKMLEDAALQLGVGEV